jgi:hypothetical protein
MLRPAPSVAPVGQHTIFIGLPKSGKTTEADQEIDRRLEGACELALIHDPWGADIGGKGYTGELLWSVEELRKRKDFKSRRLVFRAEKPTRIVRAALELGAIYQRRILVVVDEFDKLCAKGDRFVDDPPVQRGIPLEDQPRGPTYEIMNYGRHHGVEMFGTSRRPANICPSARANAERIYLFRVAEPADLDWIRDATDKATVERVKALRELEYLLWHRFEGVTGPHRVRFRR